jgi:NAD(P)-dependent dehydrogenase (short-subunit alcohol dehydrogenase family)
MTARTGRVAVITGASSGIGKEVALVLARQGWRIIGAGRDARRCAEAKAEIRAAANDAQVDMLSADLSVMKEAQRLALAIAALTDRIDVLFNNAGGMTDRLVMTEEGLEENFAGNHLGPFVLTDRLLPLLKATASGLAARSVRILQTASDASEMIPAIDLDDIQGLAHYDPGYAYCRGKLANVLFTRALAGRLHGSGIVTHCYQPGPVASNFQSHASPEVQERMRQIVMLTPEQGADTLLWLATAEEPGRSSGLYWIERAIRPPNPVVEDAAYVERFWAASEALLVKAGIRL